MNVRESPLEVMVSLLSPAFSEVGAGHVTFELPPVPVAEPPAPPVPLPPVPPVPVAPPAAPPVPLPPVPPVADPPVPVVPPVACPPVPVMPPVAEPPLPVMPPVACPPVPGVPPVEGVPPVPVVPPVAGVPPVPVVPPVPPPPPDAPQADNQMSAVARADHRSAVEGALPDGIMTLPCSCVGRSCRVAQRMSPRTTRARPDRGSTDVRVLLMRERRQIDHRIDLPCVVITEGSSSGTCPTRGSRSRTTDSCRSEFRSAPCRALSRRRRRTSDTPGRRHCRPTPAACLSTC